MKFVIDHSVAFLYKCGYYRLVSAGQRRRIRVSLWSESREAGSWWTFPRGRTMPRTSSSTGWRASRSRRRTMLSMTWDTNWVRLTRLFMRFRWGIFVMSGIHKDREDELEELMPSCFCLNMVDCITVRISSVFCRNKRWTIRRVVICDDGVTAQWYHGGKLSSRWAAIVRDYTLLAPGVRGAEITITTLRLSHLCEPRLLDMATPHTWLPPAAPLNTKQYRSCHIKINISEFFWHHSTPVPSLTSPSSRDRLGPATALAPSREK